MYPCFRGLVLNVVLDVFLPLIGVWLQGERWQLGETALPLMNSSSSILPKRPVDTALLPVNKASHHSVSGPHGLAPLFVTLLSSPLELFLLAHTLWRLQVFYLRVSTLLLSQMHFCFYSPSLFNYLALPSSANDWLSPVKWRPCCLHCSSFTKGHYLGLGMSQGRVCREKAKSV